MTDELYVHMDEHGDVFKKTVVCIEKPRETDIADAPE